MIEYVNQLHEGNVEAYVGIVQGLASGGKSKYSTRALKIFPHLNMSTNRQPNPPRSTLDCTLCSCSIHISEHRCRG
jgi:hypothetical protein